MGFNTLDDEDRNRESEERLGELQKRSAMRNETPVEITPFR